MSTSFSKVSSTAVEAITNAIINSSTDAKNDKFALVITCEPPFIVREFAAYLNLIDRIGLLPFVIYRFILAGILFFI